MPRLTKDQQTALVASARTGDEDAIACLYNDAAPLIRRALRRMVSENDIDDIVQESMRKAFERIDQYRDEATFSTWCVKIAKNDGLALRRRDKRKQGVIVASLDDTMTPDGEAKKPIDVGYEDRAIERNHAFRTVHAALSTLSPQQAAVLRMKLDGVDNETIARSIGRTLAYTKTIVFRAREALKEAIEGKKAALRICACGCGGTVPHMRGAPYIKGHRKLAKAA